MAKTKVPRKQHRPPVERLTTTPFSTVMIRTHMAIEQLRLGSGLELTPFHRLVMAWQVTKRLKLTENEGRQLERFADALTRMSQAFRTSDNARLKGLSPDEMAVVMEGLNTMQAIWDRNPPAYLERCYDAVFHESLSKAESLIKGREKSFG